MTFQTSDRQKHALRAEDSTLLKAMIPESGDIIFIIIIIIIMLFLSYSDIHITEN